MPGVFDADPEYAARKAQLETVQAMDPLQRQAVGASLSGQVGGTPSMDAATINARSQMAAPPVAQRRNVTSTMYPPNRVLQGNVPLPDQSPFAPTSPPNYVEAWQQPQPGDSVKAGMYIPPVQRDTIRGGLPAVPGAYAGGAAGGSSGRVAGPRANNSSGRVARAPQQPTSGVRFPRGAPPQGAVQSGNVAFPANVAQTEPLGQFNKGLTADSRFADFHAITAIPGGKEFLAGDPTIAEVVAFLTKQGIANTWDEERLKKDGGKRYSEIFPAAQAWAQQPTSATTFPGGDATASTVPQAAAPAAARQFAGGGKLTPKQGETQGDYDARYERAMAARAGVFPGRAAREAKRAPQTVDQYDPDTGAVTRMPVGPNGEMPQRPHNPREQALDMRQRELDYQHQQDAAKEAHAREREAVGDTRYAEGVAHTAAREGVADTHYQEGVTRADAALGVAKLHYDEGIKRNDDTLAVAKQRYDEGIKRADDEIGRKKVEQDYQHAKDDYNKEQDRLKLEHQTQRDEINDTRYDEEKTYNRAHAAEKERISSAQWAYKNGIGLDKDTSAELAKNDTDVYNAGQEVADAQGIIKNTKEKFFADNPNPDQEDLDRLRKQLDVIRANLLTPAQDALSDALAAQRDGRSAAATAAGVTPQSFDNQPAQQAQPQQAPQAAPAQQQGARPEPMARMKGSEEVKFRAWYRARQKAQGLKGMNPDDPKEFYDSRRYWAENGEPTPADAAEGHLPDTYKLPGHPSFSSESMYYQPGDDISGSESDQDVDAAQVQRGSADLADAGIDIEAVVPHVMEAIQQIGLIGDVSEDDIREALTTPRGIAWVKSLVGEDAMQP